MAHVRDDRFQEWIKSKNISLKIKEVLQSQDYLSIDAISFLSNDVIERFEELNVEEKRILKSAVNEYSDDGCISKERKVIDQKTDYEQVRWKEFGMARPHKSWEMDFYPVELFSPDGFWAWNVFAKSQTYKGSKVSKVWNKFEENKPGWLLAPPVLLPSELKSYKLNFSLRLKPNDEDYPILQIILVNDKYNQQIFKESDYLKFQMSLSFINIANQQKMGESMVNDIVLKELHESYDYKLPGRILNLKKPPIVVCKIQF